MNSQANTKITLRAVDRTSPGAKPKINQDSAARTSNSTLEKNGGYPSIYVVADGVGGLDKGEVASRLAVDAVMNVFSHGRGKREETSTVVDLPREATQATDFLSRVDTCVEAAHKAVLKEMENTGLRMASTLGGLAVSEDGEAIVFNLGDTRVYRFRQGEIRQLSTDQVSSSSGMVSDEIGKRSTKLSSYLGQPKPLEPAYSRWEIRDGDDYLICTDGLWSMVEASEMRPIIESQPMDKAADALIKLAVDRGAPDNVTLVLVHAGKIRKQGRGIPLWLIIALLVLLIVAAAFVATDGGKSIIALLNTATPSPTEPPTPTVTLTPSATATDSPTATATPDASQTAVILNNTATRAAEIREITQVAVAAAATSTQAAIAALDAIQQVTANAQSTNNALATSTAQIATETAVQQLTETSVFEQGATATAAQEANNLTQTAIAQATESAIQATDAAMQTITAQTAAAQATTDTVQTATAAIIETQQALINQTATAAILETQAFVDAMATQNIQTQTAAVIPPTVTLAGVDPNLAALLGTPSPTPSETFTPTPSLTPTVATPAPQNTPQPAVVEGEPFVCEPSETAFTLTVLTAGQSMRAIERYTLTAPIKFEVLANEIRYNKESQREHTALVRVLEGEHTGKVGFVSGAFAVSAIPDDPKDGACLYSRTDINSIVQRCFTLESGERAEILARQPNRPRWLFAKLPKSVQVERDTLGWVFIPNLSISGCTAMLPVYDAAIHGEPAQIRPMLTPTVTQSTPEGENTILDSTAEISPSAQP